MDKSESSGYKDFVWAIGINRLNLKLVGLWPKTNEVSKRRLGSDICAGFTFIMLAFVIGIPMVHALIRVSGDMALMIDNLQMTLIILTILLEFLIMRRKQEVISSIIIMIEEDWLRLKLNTERDVMIKRAWIARLVTISVAVVTIPAYTFLIIIPYFHLPVRQLTNLTDRNRPLPLQTYYVYDTDNSLQFELTFFAQAIAVLLAIFIYVGVSGFLGFAILHMYGQLENFKRQLNNLTSCKDFNKALSSCIVTHLRLIRYANNVEHTFTLILFLLVLEFSIIFCLCGFVLVIMITDENMNTAKLSQLSYTLIVVISQLMQTFIYCFGGDLISGQCDAVYRTICDLDWYTWEPHEAKNIILLMLLTKKPFCITAGKILPLTMATFCNVGGICYLNLLLYC
ncbi:Odorant receptor 209 [Nylanderia fulva]|uniref:Odorant receptor n=1 Tax=Nylanderia fulva TaxID=613905 RepID=A0A6G1LQ95_9HYME|nr:Odorant receptor 209 [Nylanderia fulva]